MKSGHLVSTFLVAIALAAMPRPALAADTSPTHTFVIGTNDFLLDGQRFQIRCGEVHAARVPEEYWRDRLKMAKAMGLNTVCAYLFWNEHEPQPGQFDWSGQADVAKFCRIAQEEGLWVILRPGPYSCAEWEMGGLPWWLLKDDDIKLRTRDPRFINAATNYLAEVGREFRPLLVTHGGPILMVQVENEYGFYGNDAGYMGELRTAMIIAGIDVPLFACNPPYDLKNGYRSDLFPVVNFGSNPQSSFESLREVLPQGPLMCGEFYPGWFDTWGKPHHLGHTDSYLSDLEYMLQHDESFSIYMAHGGTTFGLWSGADRPFKPDTSSYDYDAPISEAGWPTEKFYQTRALFAKYLLPGETLPPVPATNPVITIAPFKLKQCAPVLANLPPPISDDQPKPMEDYNQGYGCILYQTRLPAGPAGQLAAMAIHDFGYVFLDGKPIGITDRRSNTYSVELPARTQASTLDILVEPMGRVNFGQEVHDHKGIRGPVTFTPTNGPAAGLTGWNVYTLPLDDLMLNNLKFARARKADLHMPAFWRGTFKVLDPEDTFLDLRSWGKGVVWVNGHCLGRFWDIGPTQTAYLPGPWLKRGVNEIIILDYLGPREAVMAGLTQPILSQLRPGLDFARGHHPAVTLNLAAATPVMQDAFAPGPQMQIVNFAQPARGRYFCIEPLDSFNGKPDAAIAELSLLGSDGKPLSTEDWKVAYVDSEELAKEDGAAENAIDGQIADYWHTSSTSTGQPHQLILDLGKSVQISGFQYTPRQGKDSVSGRVKDYRIYIGNDLVIKN
jgi:beta-galactosidase